MDRFGITPMVGMGFSLILLMLDIVLRIVILYLSFLAIKALKFYIKERK